MREMMLIAIGVAAIVGATYFLLKDQVPAQVAVPAEKPLEQKATTPDSKTSKNSTKRQGKRIAKLTPEIASTEVWVDLNGPVSPELSFGKALGSELVFPKPNDFRRGMLRSEVERAYGTPTLSTMQSRSGRLLQRYVYMNQDKTAITIALLEDGRVVNAVNMPQ